ncbi:SusC/RagA family TonB-linked outer membrane protein [Chitinophaga sp. CC14]|uniref:SusC/RagA family TonB-linked outer membrane protein n=1 Tax=Chitinophaga sp. CC14 TaxID=3029199 RepID=UPI003B7BFE07
MKIALNKLMGVLLAIAISTIAVAQPKKITGRIISSEDQQPLPGVSIVIKGKKTAAITNAEGYFSIEAAPEDVLRISYIGFTPQEIAAGNRSTVNISLVSATSKMDEIIVVGYGTQKKSSLTASVARLDKRILESGIRANPAQALAGTIAGVRVSTNSGKPGAIPNIILRGGTNFDGSGSPLIIIDGQFRPSLSDINPEDIASMEVLKDASATAIYGARASNGVIMITTKRGKSGTSEINLKVKTGFNYLNSPYTLLTPEEYLYWGRKALVETYKVNGNQSLLNASGPRGTGNVYKDAAGNIIDGNYDLNALFSPMRLTDQNRELLSANDGWKVMKDAIPTNAAGQYDPNGTYADLIYKGFSYGDNAFNKKSLTQDYNISMTGGNEKGAYYANLGYYNEDGIARKSFYKRLNFTLNGDYKIRTWLKSESNVSFSRANSRDQAQTSDVNYWGRLLMAAPTMRGNNSNGEPLLGRNAGDGNPAVNMDKYSRKNQADKFTLAQSFKVDLYKDLYFRVGAILMYDESFNESFNKDFRTGVMSKTDPNAGWDRTRSSNAAFDRTVRQTYNATLNYNKIIHDDHSIDAMIGGEFFDAYNYGLSASGKLAPTDDFPTLGLTSSDANTRGQNSYHLRERILSGFGRINYDWKGKYLATFTARRDGYSRLIGDNQYGLFPGASVGWLLHKENFMVNTSKWLSFLKLRGSWGKNGNIGEVGKRSDGTIDVYSLQGGYPATTRYESIIGFSLGGIPNPGLRWEKTNTIEGAVEYGLFNNRLNGSIAYYNRNTTDKIASVSLPGSAGVNSILTNNGSMRNRGFEADLNYKVLQSGNWNVSVGANVAWNKNTVLKLPFNGNEKNRQNGAQIYDPASGRVIWAGGLQEGQEPGEIFGYLTDGIIRTTADLAAYNKIDLAAGQVQLNNAAGRPVASQQLIDKNGLTGFWATSLGDMKWKDLDRNDTIDFRDRVSLGRTIPRWTGGFNVAAGWKGLQLFARLDYAIGFIQMDVKQMWALGSMQGEFNGTDLVKDTWTPENPNAKYPIYVNQDQQLKKNYDRHSDMFWKNSSYLAFREVTLSYTVPKKILNNANIAGLTVMVTGQNLGYISNKMLALPERTGQQDGVYTIPTSLVFSANLTF